MIVILIIGVILSVAIPQFLSARSRSRQKTCVSNLRQLNGAKDHYAMEQNLPDGTPVNPADIAPAYIRNFPSCPEGGTYTLNPTGQGVVCSIIVGSYAHIYPY